MGKFCDQLKAARTRARLTQKQLAEKLGLSPTSLVNYEAGKRVPDVETAVRMAEALHVDIADFLAPLLISTNVALDKSEFQGNIRNTQQQKALEEIDRMTRDELIQYLMDEAKYWKAEAEKAKAEAERLRGKDKGGSKRTG